MVGLALLWHSTRWWQRLRGTVQLAIDSSARMPSLLLFPIPSGDIDNEYHSHQIPVIGSQLVTWTVKPDKLIVSSPCDICAKEITAFIFGLYISKSNDRVYKNMLPYRQNRPAFVIQSCKTDPYLSCICIVFEKKDCLRLWYLAAEMYSESSNCGNPVFESRSGTKTV